MFTLGLILAFIGGLVTDTPLLWGGAILVALVIGFIAAVAD